MTTLWTVCALACAAAQDARNQDAPKPVKLGPIAVVSDFRHDFGTVTAGPVLEHTFIVANTGDEPLVITRFNAACGCTSLTEVPPPIEPGQTADIPVSLRTAWLRGPFHKSVEIHTNETDRAMVLLEGTGEVEPRYDVLPAAVSFGKVRPDAPVTTKVSLRTLAGPPMHPTVIRAPKGLEARVAPDAKSGMFTLTITGRTPQSPGVHDDEIFIATGLDEHPDLRIPVTMLVQGALSAAPSALTFTPGQSAITAVVEASEGFSPAKPTVSTSGGFNATLDELTPGRRWLLTALRPSRDGSADTPESAIRLSVPGGSAMALEIPIRVIEKR